MIKRELYSKLGTPSAYEGGGGGRGVHSQPGKKLPLRNVPKEERKFRPNMSAKKNVHVPLRYDKIKTKKVGEKKKKRVKGRG